jgi:glutathione S-transferase
MPNRLHSLQFSHFCERARWGLEYMGVDFEEISWAPGLHTFLAKSLNCKSTSVPILDAGGVVIQGSDQILNYCGVDGCDQEVEERFETRLGPLVRQYVYSGTLSNPGSAMRSVLLKDLNIRQKIAGCIMWPLTKRVMITRMDCRPELLSRLEADLEEEFDWFERRLRERPYISDRGFGRSDNRKAFWRVNVGEHDARRRHVVLRRFLIRNRAL